MDDPPGVTGWGECADDCGSARVQGKDLVKFTVKAGGAVLHAEVDTCLHHPLDRPVACAEPNPLAESPSSELLGVSVAGVRGDVAEGRG